MHPFLLKIVWSTQKLDIAKDEPKVKVKVDSARVGATFESYVTDFFALQ